MDPKDLPILTHEFVLGANIAVSQRDTERGEYTGATTRERAVTVDPYYGQITRTRSRHYIAAWARRTIERPEMSYDE